MERKNPEISYAHIRMFNRFFFREDTLRLKMALCAFIVLIGGCSYGTHLWLLEKSDGDKTYQEVRVIPADFNTVWKTLNSVLRDDYQIYLKDKPSGMIYTKWRTVIQKERGKILEGRNLLHNVPIDEKDESEQRSLLAEFEVKNRLFFHIMENPDSSSTITASSVVKVTTHDYYEKSHDNDRFANKIFSTAEFNLKEEKRVLDDIQKIIEKKRAK